MALLDNPPPSRWTIKEVKGRLVVFDNETGAPPLNAAERMAEWDRKAGHQPSGAPHFGSDDKSADAGAALPPRTASPKRQRETQNPWGAHVGSAKAAPRSQVPSPLQAQRPAAARPNTDPKQQPMPTNAPTAHAAQGGVRNSIKFTTRAAWDSKGPRTIELGDIGQQHLAKMLIIGFIGLVFMEILIWSMESLSGLFVHAALIIILWPRRADMIRHLLDHLIAQDKKSQL